MLNSSMLQHDVAVVTGAAQGNGRAIALGLAQQRAAVAVADINEAGAEEVTEEIRRTGGRAWATALDVTSSDQCASFAQRVIGELGTVSILVNNAGIMRRGEVDAEDFTRDWHAMFDVNVHGCLHMVQALLPQLKEMRGRIVNICSVYSFVARPSVPGYCATKGALMQFTKSLAVDLAADGVRVNGIAPGFVDTPMTERLRNNPEMLGAVMAHTPLRRMAQPQELVGPVLFLVSPMSEYVTGAIVPVDGGYLAL